jgi:prolyl-tRNA editing enzyme YbaK/EbsC (Cys-tRNA(Pro) deacylase)
MTDLPRSAARVQAAADALRIPIRVREMPAATRTAEEAAAACGCPVAAIVKSLVFLGADSDRPYLLLVSGRNRVDETGVAAQLGEALKRPDAAAVRALTGYAIGGIPPFGHTSPIATFIDPDLLGFDEVWAAAGTPHAVFAVAPALLMERTGAQVLRMTGP